MMRPSDLAANFATAIKASDLFAAMVKHSATWRVLPLLRDQLSVDPAVEPLWQKTVASAITEWGLDQLVESKSLRRERWLSESDRRALGSAVVFILIGAAVLAAMEAAPQAFDHWNAWVGTTTGLTSLVLYVLYQKRD
jgi:hypothetical protein